MTKTSWRSYYCNYRRVSSCIKFFLSLTVCSLILMALLMVQFSSFALWSLSEIIHRKTLIFGFNSSYLWSKRRSEFDLILPNDVTSQIWMVHENTLKKKKLKTHRLLRMRFAIKNHTRTPIWSGPEEDDEFNIKKELNQRTSAATAAIFDIIKCQRNLGRSILTFFALWAPVTRFPTNRRFFRQNGRISGIVLRGIYATSELNSTTTTTANQNLWTCSISF